MDKIAGETELRLLIRMGPVTARLLQRTKPGPFTITINDLVVPTSVMSTFVDDSILSEKVKKRRMKSYSK